MWSHASPVTNMKNRFPCPDCSRQPMASTAMSTVMPTVTSSSARDASFRLNSSKDSRNWRLFGNSRKTYKQPIALDETGHWDTWYRRLRRRPSKVAGSVAGQVLGHLADALDPIWPQAIRQRLPRWWADQAFRRHHAADRRLPMTLPGNSIAQIHAERMPR